MEVYLNPELTRKLDELATKTGRAADELVQDPVAGLIDDLAGTREMLDRRYDEIKSGRVTSMDGEEAFKRLLDESERRRS